MKTLKNYGWELTHGTAIAAVIITLAVAIRLTGTPLIENQPASKATGAVANPSPLTSAATVPMNPAVAGFPAPDATPSDPHEVIVGPTGISNRYKLLSVDPKPRSSTSDDLTVKLHVQSLAMDNLVSPFESSMFELKSPGLDPIHPRNPFRSPLPSGTRRNYEIVFSIPKALNLSHATLLIHYYNYQNEIPLDLTIIPAHAPE